MKINFNCYENGLLYNACCSKMSKCFVYFKEKRKSY